MPWHKIIIFVLALIQGLWFTFDGGRALFKGEYTTASSGPRAGQLGPWSKVVASIGIAPRGFTMKITHLILGFIWLISMFLFGFRSSLGKPALILCSVASLWYLPLGTLLSIVELLLLLRFGDPN